jgi:hypothetical protein
MPPEIEALLQEIESYADTNDFKYEMEARMEKLQALGAGPELIPSLLAMMERHPLTEFGSPGEMVRFMEGFFGMGYEEQLAASLARRPTLHTLWMANRVVNSSALPEETRQQLLASLWQAARSPEAEETVRARAKEYLTYQSGRQQREG